VIAPEGAGADDGNIDGIRACQVRILGQAETLKGKVYLNLITRSAAIGFRSARFSPVGLETVPSARSEFFQQGDLTGMIKARVGLLHEA
jgi:hypothetical protein